jgi:hypothetical protein
MLPFVHRMDSQRPPSADSRSPTPGLAKTRAKADRVSREAAALRGNLLKRKDQARQRAAAAKPEDAACRSTRTGEFSR